MPTTRRPLAVFAVLAALVALAAAAPAAADYRIARDFGGQVDQYKARYAMLRDKGERVVIDGICNSACTLVLGMVPRNQVCVTPKASLGFHQAYIDPKWTFGIKVMSDDGTADLMRYYPQPVKDWIRRQGGLTPQMKRVKNGTDLWTMVDPCPDEF